MSAWKSERESSNHQTNEGEKGKLGHLIGTMEGRDRFASPDISSHPPRAEGLDCQSAMTQLPLVMSIV
jgi:hypothetical protein